MTCLTPKACLIKRIDGFVALLRGHLSVFQKLNSHFLAPGSDVETSIEKIKFDEFGLRVFKLTSNPSFNIPRLLHQAQGFCFNQTTLVPHN